MQKYFLILKKKHLKIGLCFLKINPYMEIHNKQFFTCLGKGPLLERVAYSCFC